jgi:KaiC/GvpD/RAD55 family RecA-like ATPase
MGKKQSIGIKDLDRNLKGGLTEGSIMLVIGEPGTGKSTLLRRFAYEGLDAGEHCLYLLSNNALDKVLPSMQRNGMDISKKKGIKFILYSGIVKKRSEMLVGNFEDLVDVAYNVERVVSSFRKGSTRMVVEDLSYLFLMNSKEMVFKFMHRINQILRERNVTALIEVQKGMLDPQIVTALESTTDGTIETKKDAGKKCARISRYEEQVDEGWVVTHLVTDDELIDHLDHWQEMLQDQDPEKGDIKVKRMLSSMRKNTET